MSACMYYLWMVSKPFTDHFPQADIYELLSPDLLHQIIKGTFKDHLVTWVTEYVEVVPSFSGLCHFSQGHGFKQWTGDDSKALMNVYLPTIAGLVPDQIVCTLSAFIEFCYIVCHSQTDERVLTAIDNAVMCFHHEHVIFIDEDIRDDFSLPHQHALFGTPNGLCSSITESKHIKAVKEPWCQSNCNDALGQMLLTNQQLDKLATLQAHLESSRFLTGKAENPQVGQAPNRDTDPEEAVVEGVQSTGDEHEDAEVFGMDVDLHLCPSINPTLSVKVFHMALATYFAPSDLSGIGGMYHEYICTTPKWQQGTPHHDCIFIVTNPEKDGFAGLHAAQIQLFFSFKFEGVTYPSAHLTGVYGPQSIPCTLTFSQALQSFNMYYVNKYADHHAHEIAF
ncbi:hypothetical protein BDQ12DRAFT_698238 [Crucibulum laeve]|uniref:Uncharacterized protein n=1 Tax=Crucibulum laeve TaxID=68775 RepID=A0A5C3M3L1_9AGAR|nr:hypothetical protein BDQ12DRAFT_698238 [Crucibulum laeve]